MAEMDSLIQLDDFVSAELIQIIDGVKSAQGNVKNKVGTVNPRAYENVYQNIEFDIVITATESAQTEGTSGALIAVIGASLKGKTDVSASSVSRIKFSVPTLLPEQAVKFT